MNFGDTMEITAFRQLHSKLAQRERTLAGSSASAGSTATGSLLPAGKRGILKRGGGVGQAVVPLGVRKDGEKVRRDGNKKRVPLGEIHENNHSGM